MASIPERHHLTIASYAACDAKALGFVVRREEVYSRAWGALRLGVGTGCHPMSPDAHREQNVICTFGTTYACLPGGITALQAVQAVDSSFTTICLTAYGRAIGFPSLRDALRLDDSEGYGANPVVSIPSKQ